MATPLSAPTPLVVKSPFTSLSGSIDASHTVPVIFTIVFGIWLIYTIVAAFHLFRYGGHSWFSAPLFFVHLLVSGYLILYMVSGFHA